MNFTDRQFSSPANIKYYGLAKKGATCYLNSVLQVLFMTKDFREAVIRHSNENSQFIDQDLKALFEDLENHTAETDGIIQKLGIGNVYELHDAAEYFEKVLTLTSPQASQIFRGILAKKTTCCKCLAKTDRDRPFWHLPLALVDSCIGTRGSEVYRVVDGIEEFFRPTELNGENQMHCDQCGHKVDATSTDVIKHHPDVLLLFPKRFEFSYHYMSYVKINCSLEVPYTLQTPENQTYELYAVVDHFGDMRSGYYCARIKIQDEHEDRWYKFDDTRVTLLDWQPFQMDNTEKSESAYLLFYRKKKNAATEEIKEMYTSGIFNTDNSDQCQELGKEAEEAEIHKNVVVKKEGGYLTKQNNSHAACQGDEGSDSARQDTGEYEGDTQNVGKDYRPKCATGERRLLTRYDLYFNGSQGSQTGSDRIQIIPKDNQRHKQGSACRFPIERIEEEVKGEASVHNVTYSALKEVHVETQTRDVRDDMGEKKGADKYIQRSKITTEKPDHSKAVKLESMRLDDLGQKTTENILSVTHTTRSVGGVEIQSKEQKNDGDGKQNQSEGKKALNKRLTEKQEGDCDENVGLESVQPKTRTGIQGVTEGGRHSKKSSPHVKVMDEEHTEIPSACKDSSKSKTIIRKTVDETSQNLTRWLESQRNITRNLNL